MARSYKRGWVCDRNPWAKNQANRHIRRIKWDKEIPNGKAYRKYYNPWHICDWRWEIDPYEGRYAYWNIYSWWTEEEKAKEEYKWTKKYFKRGKKFYKRC